MKVRLVLALVVYMATIPLANWFIGHVGDVSFPGGPHTIPVGFGYSAPSGVLWIGVALVARDFVQRWAGKTPVLCAIAVGIGLSYALNPTIATASALAFGLGELVDFVVYTPLYRRHLIAAVVASGVAGAIIDTFVFLQIAFGSIMFWQGQIIGKVAVSVAAGLLMLAARTRRRSLAVA